jgi:hypothetical protein
MTCTLGRGAEDAAPSYIRPQAVNGRYACAVQAVSWVALQPNDIKEGVFNESFW